MFRSIRWRIVAPFIALTLTTMFGLGAYLSSWVRDTYLQELEVRLCDNARLIADALATDPAWEDPEGNLDPAARGYAELLGARITLIAASGAVVGESHENRAGMDNHFLRPEVQQALQEGHGVALRFSRTMGYEMMYAAVPVVAEGRTVGFARVALPLSQVEARIARLRLSILWATLLAALSTAALAALIAERIVRPIRRLTGVVQQMADGDLSVRLLSTARDEVGSLTRAFNQMADRLRSTIAALVKERSRLNAVLENMSDGAIITDENGQVQFINPAAARILGVSEREALNRSFAEVARDHRIIDLWQQCNQQREELIGAVEITHRGTFLQVVVTPLQEVHPGASLVILQDLTRVRRLETVRRDFISNISHELRTPLASLKALTETLREGALEDPPAARRFLDQMETEVDALTQIVQELLELSRIESGQAPFRMVPAQVDDFVLPPIERLRPLAERSGLAVTVSLPELLPQVQADPERMQQVVTNLVHNGIKFTPPGGEVHVTGYRLQVSSDGEVLSEPPGLKSGTLPPGEWVVIAVRDTGVGIAPEDLPRIFERFYKADRARSGGGTGLGLAIAKHIVQAHGGHIWAESVEGRGSTFYVALPAPSSSPNSPHRDTEGTEFHRKF